MALELDLVIPGALVWSRCLWCGKVFSVNRKRHGGKRRKWCDTCRPIVRRLAWSKAQRKRADQYRSWVRQVETIIGARRHWKMYSCRGAATCGNVIIVGRGAKGLPDWIPAFDYAGLDDQPGYHARVTVFGKYILFAGRRGRPPMVCPDCGLNSRYSIARIAASA